MTQFGVLYISERWWGP